MKCLSLFEMFDLLRADGDDHALELFSKSAEALANVVASYIAGKHMVECNQATTEPTQMGGTAVYFGPIAPGDPEPDPFKHFDQGQPWNEE